MSPEATAALTSPPLASGHDDPTSLGVFRLNRDAPFHRWVDLTEGFSAQLVAQELGRHPHASLIYDPFGGTGTTPLVAVETGRTAAWAEVNPYLREVAKTKLAAAVASASEREEAACSLRAAALQGPELEAITGEEPLVSASASRDFFDAGVAAELVGWVRRFALIDDPLAVQLGRLAVASCAIRVSKMKRAVDLRRRTPGELARPRPPVGDAVRGRLNLIVEDLLSTAGVRGTAAPVSEDARSLPEDFGPVDLTVTSPPYLNGTNYCRNTKLELLLLGLIRSEAELKDLRSRSITAGINNVSRRIRPWRTIEAVERVAERLDECAYDARIPSMIRAYFSDMRAVLETTRRASREGAELVLDIGDSRFAGVHVDTPGLLADIAEGVGWRLAGAEVIRSRIAKDGNPLCQKLLRLCSV